MFGTSSSLFGQKAERRSVTPKSFLAVAHPIYGASIEPNKLASPEFYAAFSNFLQFSGYCGRAPFSEEQRARENAQRRSVAEKSAYVVALDCPPSKVDTIARQGTLFDHVVSFENAITGEKVSVLHT